MIIHDVIQGSPEWLALRLGIPTASEFDRIFTPTGNLAKNETARRYAYFMLAEKLLNRPLAALDHLEWVQRGKDLEADAVRAYEFEFDVETQLVGFITTDDGRTGASPDRLVGTAGLLEIKCPAPQTHVGYMLEGFGAAYHVQVQGQLLVTGREWCDRFAYNPEMPPVRQRSYRDEPFIAGLAAALLEFNDMRDSMLAKLQDSGMFAARDRIATPHQQWAEAVGAQHD